LARLIDQQPGVRVIHRGAVTRTFKPFGCGKNRQMSLVLLLVLNFSADEMSVFFFQPSPVNGPGNLIPIPYSNTARVYGRLS
jgi:hypothetical protein